MIELITKLRDLKKEYEGKTFKEMGYGDCCSPILASEDGGDTDLHKCVVSNYNGEEWIAFYVEVNPKTDIIVRIDLNCVDIWNNGDFRDCIDLDNI